MNEKNNGGNGHCNGEGDVEKYVADATVRMFFKRNGVPDEKFASLLTSSEDLEPARVEICWICKSEVRKVCDKCKKEYSACRKSETNYWYLHNFTSCRCAKSPGNKVVYGILLPEKADKPVLTQVRIGKRFNEEEEVYVDKVDQRPYFGEEFVSVRYMNLKPFIKGKSLGHTLYIEFKDNFLNDGSQVNQLVKKLTGYQNPSEWRGPLLVLKGKDTNLQVSVSYEDVTFEDLSDVIDFFTVYGSSLPLFK